MKIRHISALFLTTAILAGCSDGEDIQGLCGVRQDNPNVVVGGNSRVCEEHAQSKFTYAFSPGAAIQSIPEGDKAREGIKNQFEDDQALSNLQKQASADATVIRWAYLTAFYIVAVIMLAFASSRMTYARATNEIDIREPGTKRYEHWAFFVPIAGVVALAPWQTGELGRDEYSTVATRIYTVFNMHSNIAESLMASEILSNTQSEGLTQNELSNEARVYSATRAKSKSIAGNFIRSEMQDIQTSKFYLQRENTMASVEDRKVEYQTPPQIEIDESGFLIFRPKEGYTTKEFTLTQLAKLNATSNFPLKAPLEAKIKQIGYGYLTSDIGQYKASLQGFKNEIMDSTGAAESNQNINNAVMKFSMELNKHIWKDEYLKVREQSRKIARLAGEEACSWPAESKITDYVAFTKEQREYVKYLKGERDDPAYDAFISCVAEPKKGEYVIHGMRPLEVVREEKRAETIKLVEMLDPIVEQIEAGQILTLIDSANSGACVEARQGGGAIFAAKFKECLLSTKQNKAMVQAYSNYTITAFGGGSYVDTSYDLQGNLAFSTLMDNDYNAIINDALDAVESKASLRATSQDETLRALIENNLGDETGMQGYIKYILNPFTALKADLGITKDCEKTMMTCLDPVIAYSAIDNVANRMIEGGSFVALSSFGISKLINQFNKSTDKSKDGSKLSGKKKGKSDSSVLSKAAKTLEFLLNMMTPIGFIILAAGLLVKYILAIPTLLFTIIMILIAIDILIKLLIAPARFLTLFMPMDKDNKKAFLSKLVHEYLYIVLIKPIVMIVIFVFFTFYGYTLFATAQFVISVAQQGWKEAILMAVIIVPILYMVTLLFLKACLEIIERLIQVLGGSDTILEATRTTMEIAYNAVSLGLPMLLIWAMRSRR
ncbi:TPA: hypothetical protein NH480_002850 [Pseudomonas aeruginosa]|nr:hypothetical protein [Pseudomonas aeruginosa]